MLLKQVGLRSTLGSVRGWGNAIGLCSRTILFAAIKRQMVTNGGNLASNLVVVGDSRFELETPVLSGLEV